MNPSSKDFYLDLVPNEDGVYHLEDGIYFGLPDKIYHADDALGSTSIKGLAKNPYQWQYDRIRPKDRITTEAMNWGSAWHCFLLEGKEEFDRRYAKPPTPDDIKGCLVTVDDIKEFLKFHGQKLSGAKADLILRAKEIDECPVIFDEFLAQWREDHPDHVELTRYQIQEIKDAIANMEADPFLASVMTAGSLIEGAAEVSIFWTDNGVRRKARYDYTLAPTANRVQSLVLDAKSFTTFKSGTNEHAAASKVYDECYDLQAAHYYDGYFAARRFVELWKVFGVPPRKGYLTDFFNAPSVTWVWIMTRRDSGVIPITLSIDMDDTFMKAARETVHETINLYRDMVAKFGVNELWRPPSQVPLRLNASMMPTYNRGVQREQPRNY